MHQKDAIDRRILTELQLDASLTNQQLAERVGLSASPCLRRVKALEDAGIIERRVTLLDRKKLGARVADQARRQKRPPAA